MNKKGFTLTELLVVIAIIGVVAIIAIPSIIVVNKNIKQRMYQTKIDYVIHAAESYAENNPDIFNGQTEVKVYVYELISGNYLDIDREAKAGDVCDLTLSIGGSIVTNASGCMINPVDNTSMNSNYVILTKEAVGVTATFNGDVIETIEGTLVEQVCDRFANGEFTGKYGTGENDRCKCDASKGLVSMGGTKASGTQVSACLIAGDERNNYLKYDNVMWRVMGVYDVRPGATLKAGEDAIDRLVAKMITNDNVDVQ